jgi:acyl-CoA thioester hydrolase
MDAYGHVNNVQMLQLLEEARIEAFWSHPDPQDGGRPTAVLDAGPGAGTTTLVARQEIEYLRPLAYRRAPVVIELWIGHLGGASVDVCYEVQDAVPAAQGPDRDVQTRPTVYARACTTLVLVDTTTGAPRRITDDERAAWAPYLGEMVALRRRGTGRPG